LVASGQSKGFKAGLKKKPSHDAMAFYIPSDSYSYQRPELLRLLPPMKDSRNRTIKMKNKILAMEAAPAAMPKKPKTPAIIAITRKIIVQRSIYLNLDG
jgi:hypothetical protein